MQLSELGRRGERERKCTNFETVANGIRIRHSTTELHLLVNIASNSKYPLHISHLQYINHTSLQTTFLIVYRRSRNTVMTRAKQQQCQQGFFSTANFSKNVKASRSRYWDVSIGDRSEFNSNISSELCKQSTISIYTIAGWY